MAKRKPTGASNAKSTSGNGGETHQTASGAFERLTTNHGVPLSDNQNSLKAGERGPTLLEDFILREKIQHFDHERIPERIVHARGSAAHGYFELTKSLAKHTRAKVLTEVGEQDRSLRQLLHRGRRRRLGRHPARCARLCREALH